VGCRKAPHGRHELAQQLAGDGGREAGEQQLDEGGGVVKVEAAAEAGLGPGGGGVEEGGAIEGKSRARQRALAP
jgi:hypothetical protein